MGLPVLILRPLLLEGWLLLLCHVWRLIEKTVVTLRRVGVHVHIHAKHACIGLCSLWAPLILPPVLVRDTGNISDCPLLMCVPL